MIFVDERKYYAIYDPSPDGCNEINYCDIESWNNKKYGIFKSVNSFLNSRREEDVCKLLQWYCDLDYGTKEDQLSSIKKLGWVPSCVNETKKGHHVYWTIEGECSVANYKYILKELLQPILNSDQKATDVSRILRQENTYHWKDINNPFEVKKIFWQDNSYLEDQVVRLLETYINKKSIKKEGGYRKPTIMNKRNAAEIAMFLNAKHRGKNEWIASCPAHKPDKNPSFSISQKGDNVLVYCHAKCSQEEVINKLKELGLW